MTAILLSALFSASALLAVTAITASWNRYGRMALSLRGELASCSEAREFRVTISEITVHSTATVLRPDFSRSDRPSRSAALPAAAA